MDNKAYLDQITVKEASQDNKSSIFSPALIKAVLGALILIVMLVVIIGIFTKQNKTSYDSYAELYQRYNKLLAEDGPLFTQKENLHSSKLRANTASFISLSKSFVDSYSSLTGSLGIDIATLSPERNTVIEDEFTSFTTNLNNAYMNGYLDSTYASECAYQIAVLIQLENDIIANTDNESLQEKLHTNLSNLQSFQAAFEEYETAE